MTKQFVFAALIRALRTAAQTAVATIGVGATDLASVPWVGVASTAALAAILSILSAVATDLPEAPRKATK